MQESERKQVKEKSELLEKIKESEKSMKVFEDS